MPISHPSCYQPTAQDIERFWSKVEKTDSCWLYKAGVTARGYGAFWLNNHQVPAHRLAYEISVGPITAGLFVCHRCDVRRCVNPRHLFLGTHTDNMRDCSQKGRIAHGLTHGFYTKPSARIHQPKLDKAGVEDIRNLIASGLTYRNVAEITGISVGCVHGIVHRKFYKHVP